MVSVNQEFVKDVTVANAYGLHARPAAEFVKLANSFKSEILVSRDGLEVNGKSIMGVMMLAAEKGVSLQIRAIGVDAQEAIEGLCALVARGFGEEEIG